MFHTINDDQYTNAPRCECGADKVWNFQYGWHCINTTCKRNVYANFMRSIANGRGGFGRTIDAQDYRLEDWSDDDE